MQPAFLCFDAKRPRPVHPAEKQRLFLVNVSTVCSQIRKDFLLYYKWQKSQNFGKGVKAE